MPGITTRPIDAVVAFVDLMGFSQRLVETWGAEEGALPKLFEIRDALASVKPVAFGANGSDALATDEVSLFSDSLIIVSRPPMYLDRQLVSMSALSVWTKVARAIQIAASCGFGVRGGIEYGGVWWDGREAIGPAFLTAYSLETAARSARVLIGPSLLRRYADERAFLEYAKELTYRCADGTFAVRPVLEAKEVLERLVEDSPTFSERYEEIVANCTAVQPGVMDQATSTMRRVPPKIYSGRKDVGWRQRLRVELHPGS